MILCLEMHLGHGGQRYGMQHDLLSLEDLRLHVSRLLVGSLGLQDLVSGIWVYIQRLRMWG